MTALKSAGAVTVSYNANAIAAYTNSVDLQNTITELEATNLGSTAEQSSAGLVNSTVRLGGDHNSTVDGYFGPDSLTGTKRTVVIVANSSTYTWTASGDVGGYVTNYQIQADAKGKTTWSAQLRLSGLGVRS